MERATISIGSTDVNVTKSNGSTVIDYPLEKANAVQFGSTASSAPTHVYVSEIATVLLYGAPSFGWRDGKFVNLATGEEYVETQPELAASYPSVNALIDDIAAKHYNRKVKMFGVIGYADGEVLPISQYGIDPPAGFKGSDSGDGTLVQMQVNPAATPVVTVPAAASSAPVVIEGKLDGTRTFVSDVRAGVEYVLHIVAPASGTIRIDCADQMGASTGKSAQVAIGGKLVQPRDANLIATLRDEYAIGRDIQPGQVLEYSVTEQIDNPGFYFEARII